MPNKHLRRFLTRLNPSPGECWLVACSGGADSVVLLRCLHECAPDWSLSLVVAHLDHGLRGAESREDAAFVAALAAKLGLPLEAQTLPPGLLDQAGKSPEESARNARHEFLERTRLRLGANRIALAHHADDQAETVLLQFLRGAGPVGLAGMPEWNPRTLQVRPLLALPRAGLEAERIRRGWPCREDSSNLDLGVPRNRVRHRLLPELEAHFNPGLRRTLAGAARIHQEWVDMGLSMAEKALGEAACQSPEARLALDCPALMAYPEPIRKLALGKALGALEQVGILTRVHLDALDVLLASKSAGRRVSLPGKLEATRERDRLVVYQAQPVPPDESRPLDIPGRVRVPEGFALESRRIGPRTDLSPNPGRIFVDPRGLVGPLSVRRRRPGDRFEPWGLGAETRLKDFLIAAGIPRRERSRLWLLSDERSVLWVIHVRPSERVRLATPPEDLIEVRCEPA